MTDVLKPVARSDTALEGGAHANFRFLAGRALEIAGKGARVLDYGCGAGEFVEYGRSQGLEAFGADVFFEGGHSEEEAARKGLLGNIVFEMENARLPFDDASFDIVCSNMVFEHVEDIDVAMAEVRRVLKPGGAFLNLFPSIGVLREGHCGVPLAHWLNRAPRVQVAWLTAARLLGLGYFTDGKTRSKWAADFSGWLRDFTTYRSQREVHRAYARHFGEISHLESTYLAYRLRDRGLRITLPRPLASWLTRRLMTMVILAR